MTKRSDARSGGLGQLRLAAEIAGLNGRDTTPPESRFFRTPDGLRLHYLDWGGDGSPIVFLHGGVLTAHTWDLVCLELRDSFRCVALDQRGHGNSDWSPSGRYLPARHADDITALIAHADLDSPALVGQSMGGVNALTYALRPGVSPALLVIVDMAPDHHFEVADRVRETVRQTSAAGDLDRLIEVAAAFNRWKDPRLRDRTVVANLRERPDGTWAFKHDDRHLDPAVIAESRGAMRDLVRDPVALQCPALVVRGGVSRIVSREDAMTLAAALPTGFYAEIAEAGHNVQGDRPRELAQILRQILLGTAISGRR